MKINVPRDAKKKNGYWKSLDNQRAALERFAQQHNFNLADWPSIDKKTIKEDKEIRSFLSNYYNDNIQQALERIYPTQQWEGFKPKRAAKHHWSSLSNQLSFLHSFSLSHNLRFPDDWVHVKVKQIIDSGGQPLLHKYNSSLSLLLSSLLPLLFPSYYHHTTPISNDISPPHTGDNINNFLDSSDNFNSGIDISRDDNMYSNNDLNDKMNRDDRMYRNNNIKRGMEEMRRKRPKNYWEKESNQREFMESLYTQYDMKSLDNWLKVSVDEFKEKGGGGLLSHYHHNFPLLLSSIYPHHHWDLPLIKIKSKLLHLQSKYSIRSISDWYRIPFRDQLLPSSSSSSSSTRRSPASIYSWLKRMHKDQRWNKDRFLKRSKKIRQRRVYIEITKILEGRHRVIEDYRHPHLISSSMSYLELDVFIPSLNVGLEYQGQHHYDDIPSAFSGIELYQSRDIQKQILCSHLRICCIPIPYWWSPSSSSSLLSSFLSSLFSHLFPSSSSPPSSSPPIPSSPPSSLSSSSSPPSIPSSSSSSPSYENTPPSFLSENTPSPSIPPSLPSFSVLVKEGEVEKDRKKRKERKKELKRMEIQREVMEEMFNKLNMKTLDDWLVLPRSHFYSNGGIKTIFKRYYSSDLQLLLSSLYPHHPWQFHLLKPSLKSISSSLFHNIDKQREYMDHLYHTLSLTCLDDWLTVPRSLFFLHGAKSLLVHYYSHSLPSLFHSLYPNYPWDWKLKEKRRMENQTKTIDRIFRKLHLTSPADWLSVSRHQFIKHGGLPLLSLYNNHFPSLLLSLYPSLNWPFLSSHTNHHNNTHGEISPSSSSLSPPLIRYKPSKGYAKSSAYLKSQLGRLVKKYAIKEKKDWYRVEWKSGERGGVDVYRTLKLLYPSLHWKKKLFQTRSKRSIQRLLFSLISQLYSSHLLMENYRHPLLLLYHNEPLELDIFLPSFNLAFEYQGEQHYHDVHVLHHELCQSRDRLKLQFTSLLSIQLIFVPYWWDHSLSSLLSSIPPSSLSCCFRKL